MPDSIFLLRKIFPDDGALFDLAKDVFEDFFHDLICKRLNWFRFKRSWLLRFPGSRAFVMTTLGESDEVWEVFRPPLPSILNIQRSISFWLQKITFDVVNFSRKWPVSDIADHRVRRMLRELINNVTSSRKHFYLHLSLQPPWHIAVCSTKAEFTASSFESNLVWSVLFDNKILDTWWHVSGFPRNDEKNVFD